MNEAALNKLRGDLAAFCIALDAEGFSDTAKKLHSHVGEFFGAIGKGGTPTIDWAAVAGKLEARAAAMHKENAALTPAARNTPFGIMTGTATIVLDMLAEAIGVGIGNPSSDRIDEVLSALRADRTALMIARKG